MYIMKERYHIPVVGVVNNGVKEGIRVTKNKNIGVIATPATIKMDIYLKEFNRIDKNLNIYQVKCPLFVGMIEKGWIDNDESNQLIKGYLSNLPENVDTLILGCTHYPLIEKYIKRHFTGNIVDPAKETAKSLKLIIGEGASSKKTSIKFFVSGDSQKFKEVAQEFLGTAIDEVEKIIL